MTARPSSFRRSPFGRHTVRLSALGSAVAIAAMLGGCGRSDAPSTAREFAKVSNDRLVQASAEPSQWLTYGGTYEEQHYSKLKQITRDNVSKLGLTWFADLDTNRGRKRRRWSSTA